MIQKTKEYLLDVQKEMKKVSWPDQQELVDYTIVTVVFTIILSLFIFGIDQVYSTILDAIYR